MPPTYDPHFLGPEPRDPAQPYWDPEMQTMPREELEALQLDRLRTLVARLVDRARRRCSGASSPTRASTHRRRSGRSTTSPPSRSRASRSCATARPSTPPFGDYRFTDWRACVRLGTSTGTTGTPTVALWTRNDIWLEYESAARNWWRTGWRPGQIVTHAHPAYLYGGGAMLSGSLEYFGMLNIWVAPPDTDEIAEQGIRMWQRVRPDVSFVAFNLNRFVEVAAKLGLDDIGLPAFQFHGVGKKGFPFMTCGAEAYAYAGGPGTAVHRRPHPRGLGHRPGRRPRHRARGSRGPVGQPRRHHARPRQRPAALRPGGGGVRVPRAVPVRRDDEAHVLGRPLQGLPHRPGPLVQRQRGRAGAPVGRGRRRSRRSSTSS